MEAVAEISELRVEAGGRLLVDGVSLRALPGRVTALVGPSGSGKTTTGRALLGEFPPGARVTGRLRTAPGGVGYVPQDPASVLNPARRAGALLHDIARLRVRHLPRPARAEALRRHLEEALEQAQLPDGTALLRRYPHQLSGGQQQRLVLAQALLAGAGAVVADEPTTGLDVLTRRAVADRLAAVAAQGIALVLLSHDLELVRALADEVLILHQGRVVESGPAPRLWTAPRSPVTRQLLGTAGEKGGDTSYEPEPEPGTAAVRPAPPATGDRPTPRGRLDVEGPGPAVLSIRELVARHGRTTSLRMPELDVRAGECLAVVGPSGSGKTTLGRCLAGLHRDHTGRLLLGGTPLPRSLRRRSTAQLAQVQYVFQDARAAFVATWPVLDQVARTAVRLRGADRAAATREALTVLAALGLPPETVRRLPAALSGGELQRAALARGLLAHPRVLVCDEITSGLDRASRDTLLAFLRARLDQDPGLALLLITHDRDTAALADRLAVLDDGEILQQGPAAEVLDRPAHAFTRALAGRAASRAAPAG
ncbi:ABC transporter ATP-binding protein [Streptomyces physcomitrii]|uniref:ABC transporter ATP-binding protein n=1 Tax=Streptomyces physcomitrii TaxID=2724184 RepID=A0ABX1H583_9ACTN|nr:ATP-binding cassette domain-containing protein [Streptomyces physcomitrii]NKI42404.1 ABC transporter ATP-binding protein [Streptomyces physcomitrii]